MKQNMKQPKKAMKMPEGVPVQKNYSGVFYTISAICILTFAGIAWYAITVQSPDEGVTLPPLGQTREENFLEPQYFRKTNEQGEIEKRTVTGMVIYYDASNRVIKLAVKDEGFVSVGYSTNTPFMIDGKKVDVTDLKQGSTITVELTELQDTEPYDFFAEAVTEEAPKEKTTEERAEELKNLPALEAKAQ